MKMCCSVELLKTVVSNFWIQVAFGAITLLYFHLRLPKPKKGTSGKSVFITGCDTGMGHRMAKYFNEIGMQVFAGCLRPDGDGALELRKLSSSKLHIVPLDIRKEDTVLNAVEFVKNHLTPEEKGLYCLINNAGVLAHVHFELMSTSMCEDVVSTNVIGTMRVTRHFLPLIQEAKGRIISVTSILARMIYPKVAVYTATKCALNGFFTSLKYEMFEHGVHVALIEPGDFSSTTDIMQWTRRHLDDIWKNLTPQERVSKLQLYEECKMRVLRNTKDSASAQESNYRYLLKDVEHAMLAEEPKFRYVSADLMTRIALCVLRNMPESWMVKLIMKKVG